MKLWQTKSTTVAYENSWISVKHDEVVRPDGSNGVYGVVSSKSDGVFVVPVDENGNTYLVLQERYTIGQESWEIVAGGADGQLPEDAAARELLEEAGVKAGKVTEILEFYYVNGFSNAKGHVCLATGIEKVSDELDKVDGIMSVRKVALSDVKDMILNHEITDGPTITAVFTVIAYLEKKEGAK